MCLQRQCCQSNRHYYSDIQAMWDLQNEVKCKVLLYSLDAPRPLQLQKLQKPGGRDFEPFFWKVTEETKGDFLTYALSICPDKIFFFQDKKFCPMLNRYHTFFSQVTMNFLALDKIFCLDKNYFIWADGRGINLLAIE